MGIEWRELSVSNPTPVPGENITISVIAGGTYTGWEFARGMDEAELERKFFDWKTGDVPWVVFGPFRASDVPGPYTYWIDHIASGQRTYVGLEVVAPTPPEFVEIYRDINIYFDLETAKYFFSVRGVRHEAPDLFSARTRIDELLAVTPPVAPPILPEWETILLYGSIGLIGVGLLWMAARR